MDDFDQVRVGVSAYGIHLFGRVRIAELPETGAAYVHFRLFATGATEEPAKLHSIHTEERQTPDGDTRYRAIFTSDDQLEWFDT